MATLQFSLYPVDMREIFSISPYVTGNSVSEELSATTAVSHLDNGNTFMITGTLFYDAQQHLLDSSTMTGMFMLDPSQQVLMGFGDFSMGFASLAALPEGFFDPTFLPGADSITGSTGADTLLGFAGNDAISGGEGNDTLNGGAGNDMLNGGAGNDRMIGGPGNDTYIVGQAGDLVTEGLNAGTDTVKSSVTCTLPANVENLLLTGAGNINGTGNGGNNVLTGNGGANVLNGGAGTDTLRGMGGNDTLVWSAPDSFDGGTGVDTLKVLAGNLDLTAIADTKIRNVETIDLTGPNNNVLKLNAQDVLDLSSSTDTLKVLGNVGDTINIDSTFASVGIANGIHTYQSGLAILKVDTDITVVA